MNLTNDMIEKAKTAASADELLKMAKENGVNMTAAEAQEYFNFLNANGPLSEDDLAQVAGGGKGESKPSPKYKKGQNVLYMRNYKGTIISDAIYVNLQRAYYYTVEFDDDYPSKDNRTLGVPEDSLTVI